MTTEYHLFVVGQNDSYVESFRTIDEARKFSKELEESFTENEDGPIEFPDAVISCIRGKEIRL